MLILTEDEKRFIIDQFKHGVYHGYLGNIYRQCLPGEVDDDLIMAKSIIKKLQMDLGKQKSNNEV